MVCNICLSSHFVVLMCEDNIYGVPSMTGPTEELIFQGLRLESQEKLEAPSKSMFLDLGLSWLDYANWIRVFTHENFIDYRQGMLWALQGLKGGVPNTEKYLHAAMQLAEQDGSWKAWQCRSFAGAWLMDYLYGLMRKHQGLTKTKSFVPVHNSTYVLWLEANHPEVIQHAESKLYWSAAVKLGDIVETAASIAWFCDDAVSIVDLLQGLLRMPLQ